MRVIYRIISELFLLISPIIILYRVFIGKENISRFPERYAFNSKQRVNGKLIWFHCSSVGELISIVPLLEKLETNLKISQILVTSNTLSSSKIFGKLSLKKTIHQFLPIDNKMIIRKFINYWKPSVFFLCESEIWPNLIKEINDKNIKLILINGRMTLRSFRKWKKIRSFSKYLFGKFHLCFSQNNETYTRLKILGAKKILKLGNLKFTTSKKLKYEFLDNKTQNFFKKKNIIITAASTHYDEENFVIQNHLYFKKKKKIKNLISIIVPRHIERTNEIKINIENSDLITHIHSSDKKIKKDVDIYIVDTYGELNKFYKISKLVFMGGSLIDHGGQNPLEAAKLGCKIIHGPFIANFSDIFKKLKLLGISRMFYNYNKGTKLVSDSFRNKKLINENRKLMNYGEKILNLTYQEVIKLI